MGRFEGKEIHLRLGLQRLLGRCEPLLCLHPMSLVVGRARLGCRVGDRRPGLVWRELLRRRPERRELVRVDLAERAEPLHTNKQRRRRKPSQITSDRFDCCA